MNSKEENIQENNAEGVGRKEETLLQKVNEQSQIEKETSESTINHAPSTLNMEVHKHPHHVTHKKKWTEYLLEFFMLFLAVFLGFVAENIREHSVEGRKEKEYVKSIIADLKTDSANLRFIVYDYSPQLNKWVDSCVTILESSSVTDERIIYQAIENATLWRHFYPNQRTLNQLKNSGNFILISRRNAVDEILNYDNRLNIYTLLLTPLTIYEHDVDTTQLRFTDYKVVRRLFTVQSNKSIDFISVNDIPEGAHLTNFDGASRKVYLNKLKQMNIEHAIMLGQYQSLFKLSIHLIQLLQKEYHLENE